MESVVEIVSAAHGGHGVARIDGQVCFVPFGFPGDTLRVDVDRRQKGVLWGRVLEIVSPSPDRLTESDDRAGSSMWMNFAYPAQAQWKLQIVRDCFARIGKMDVDPAWKETPELRLAYRTRAEFHAQGDRIGYYALGTHDVVDLKECPLSHPRLNEALTRLRTCRPQESVDITVNPEANDLLVWTRRADPEVLKVFPSAQHLKTREPRAQFLFDGVPVVNGCFSQSSLLLNRMLVAAVHGYVGDASSVLDLYSGSGNFSLTLPPSADVTGVDHNRAAVAAATAQGRGNYLAGDAGAMASALVSQQWDAIMLDPPRAGAKELVPALANAKSKRLIYVSCDPATLARDCRALVDAGWVIQAFEVLDMFPHTPHMECVCVMQRA